MDNNKIQLKRLDEPFVMVPNRLWRSVPDAAYVQIWCSIFSRANGNSDGCWATVINIAKDARIGQHKTRDAIKWLVVNGWLHETKRPGFTTVYATDLRGGRALTASVTPTPKDTPPVRGTPYEGCKTHPLRGLLDEQDPLEQDPNSLLLSGISYEIPTSAAANEFCSVVEATFQLEPPSSQDEPKRKPRAKGDDDFEKFWRTYLANAHRTVSQSKPKALAQWQKTIRTQSPASLLEALETEIAHQQAAAAAGTFVANLPDCFRWLRDERYATVHDRPVNPEMINHDTYVF
jgi:hypothetical protein